jgi:hypothetical protein
VLSRSASAFSLASADTSTSASPLPPRPPPPPNPKPSGLHSPSPADASSPHNVAVLLLAVLVTRFGAPMHPDLPGRLTAHLLAMLSSPAEPQRLAAAELLARGYGEWRDFIQDRPALIRSLFALAAAHTAGGGGNTAGSQAHTAGGAAHTAGGQAPRPATALEGEAVEGSPSPPPPHSRPSSHPHSHPHSQPHSHPHSQPPPRSVRPPVSPWSGGAAGRFHAALLSVGAEEPQLLCAEMGEQAVRMGALPAVRLAAASALVALVRSRAAMLERSLPQVRRFAQTCLLSVM